MPIVLDGESRIDDDFVDSDFDDAPNDGRVWSIFEIRALYGLIVKGLHNIDPRKSKRHHRYRDVTEKLNRALNGKYDSSKDIPVRAVAGMIKSVMMSNRGGMAFSDRSHAPRLTRRVMQRLERNLDFDGSVMEWKSWRKMTEGIKVKPPKEPYRRPLEERPVVRDAYGRILDGKGMVASTQWIHSMARNKLVKKKSKHTNTHNLGTSDPINASGSALNTASHRVADGGAVAPAINDGVSGGHDRGDATIIDGDDVFRSLGFERNDFGQSQSTSQQVPQPSLSSNVQTARPWDQRNTVPDTSSRQNNAPQGHNTSKNGFGNDMRRSFGNNTMSAWNPVNTSSFAGPAESNSTSSSFPAPVNSFDGATDSNVGTSSTDTFSQNDRFAPALYNWRDAGTGSFAPPTPRMYTPISSRGGDGVSFAPPTPRMRDLANMSSNDGLSPFGYMNSWPEVGCSATTPPVVSNTDPARADERDSASTVPVFDPTTPNCASHNASAGGVAVNGASLFDDKYEPGSNSENQTNSMSIAMSANADAISTSYSTFNADRLARLEQDPVYPRSPYGHTPSDRSQVVSIGSNFDQDRPANYASRPQGADAYNRFDRFPQAPQGYTPSRSSMLSSRAPIYSVERPWVSDNFKENVDPATVQNNTTNDEVGEGDGTGDVERAAEGGHRGVWDDY